MDETVTVRAYRKDIALLDNFMQRKKIKLYRDAIRVCIEYTNAHGGLK